MRTLKTIRDRYRSTRWGYVGRRRHQPAREFLGQAMAPIREAL